MELRLRPCADADRELQFRIYASSRSRDTDLLPWTDDEKEAFLRRQFECRENYYRSACGDAEFLIVVIDGRDAGRMVVQRGGTVVRLIDIALLPEFRDRGAGTRLIGGLIEEACRSGRAVRLCVEPGNPAERLYLRLGFVPDGERGMHREMVRNCD
jgi:ribosomal protein S18 acetylase RimI-like enzyme